MTTNYHDQRGSETQIDTRQPKTTAPNAEQMIDTNIQTLRHVDPARLQALLRAGESRVRLQSPRTDRATPSMPWRLSVLMEWIRGISGCRQCSQTSTRSTHARRSAAHNPMLLPARRVSGLRRFLVHKHASLQDNYPNALVTTWLNWLMIGGAFPLKYRKNSKKGGVR